MELDRVELIFEEHPVYTTSISMMLFLSFNGVIYIRTRVEKLGSRWLIK